MNWKSMWMEDPQDAEEKWLEAVETWTPGTEDPDYESAMQAFLDARQVQPLSCDDRGVPDWLPHYVMSRWFVADEARNGEQEILHEMVGQVFGGLEHAPAFIAGSRLAGVRECDVHPIINRLLPLPEFVDRCLPGDPTRFAIEWRVSPWKSKGMLVFGQCKPMPKRERALWSGAGKPFWRMTLSLPAWMMMDDGERERLVHHELGHAELEVSETGKETPKGRGHEMEEFAATVGRYGVMGEAQACVVAHAAAHPETVRLIEAAGWDRGQGLLFVPNGSSEPLRMVR